MTEVQNRLKKLIDEASIKLINAACPPGGDAFWKQVYTEAFKEFPNVIGLGSDGIYLNPEFNNPQFGINEDDTGEYNETEFDEPDINTFQNINVSLTMLSFVEAFGDSAYIIRDDEYPIIIREHQIIYWSGYSHDIFVYQHDESLSSEILENVVDNADDNDNRWYSYIVSGQQGFEETGMKCRKTEIDLASNYNDDLPHDKIVEFLKSSNSGLVLLYGEPGTGKTHYIRHLMYELKGRQFMVMDPSVFSCITDSSFVSLLLNNKNAVIILEDCETMLADRVTNNNVLLSTLLNLSDGIIGDNLNFKFICTFNANITKLDKALLRKGRMKVKYEFKKLTAEKTKALADKLGKSVKDGESLPLSEIYNYGEENNMSHEETKKIGFSR